MAIAPPKRLLLIAAVPVMVVVIVLIALIIRPGPAAMADQLFQRLNEHITVGNTGDLVDEVDDNYDIPAHWPHQSIVTDIWTQAEARTAEYPDADTRAVFRKTLRRVLSRYGIIAQQQGDPTLTYTIHSVTESTDGRFDAIVSLSVTGVYRKISIHEHRFTFAIDGWLRPTARIFDHDPIHLH